MYHVFADETKQDYTHTHWNVSVICSVFWHSSITQEIEEKISSIVVKHGSKELKFAWITSKKHVFMLNECFSVVFPYIKTQQLKIYAICRNSSDKRYHNIKYDENIDFDIMMYHCTKWICRRIDKWYKIICYPDERSQSQRNNINFYLNQTKKITKEQREDFKNNLFDITKDYSLHETFHIDEIIPIDSKDNWLVQLADIIGWLIWFSCVANDQYHKWLAKKNIQDSLFPDLDIEINHSKMQAAKFEVLEDFHTYCKTHKLQVGLQEKNKMYTNKDNWFHIHHYESQWDYDKAPKRR